MLKVKRILLCWMVVPALVAGLSSCKKDDNKIDPTGTYKGSVTLATLPIANDVVVTVAKAADGNYQVSLNQTIGEEVKIPLNISITSPFTDNMVEGTASITVPAAALIPIAPTSIQTALNALIQADPEATIPLNVTIDGTLRETSLDLNLTMKLPDPFTLAPALAGQGVAMLVYVGTKQK